MKTTRFHRPALGLDRLRILGPFLIAVTALVVAACNNGGSSGY